MKVYYFSQSLVESLPIIISVPHTGTEFPTSFSDVFKHQYIKCPTDTDWFLNKLYDFTPQIGISLLCAKYSRYVVDLNRDFNDLPLYNDGRPITSVTPTHTFSGDSLYLDSKELITDQEKEDRITKYYKPYHTKLSELINHLRTKFKNILLFEAHSIKSHIPNLHKEPYPDFIIGDNDGLTCHPNITRDFQETLKKNLPIKSISLNHPFKGGFITRQFSDPSNGVHTLQLEMTQTNYMCEESFTYDNDKSKSIQFALKSSLLKITQTILELP